MPVCTFTQNVDVDPEDFIGDVVEKAKAKFIRETEGKCLKNHGEVTSILDILSVQQKPLLSSGHARYTITCKAEVHRVQQGDQIEGKVTHHDSLATIIEGRCVSVCVPAHFQGPAKAVQEGEDVRVTILAVRFEGGKFSAIGRWA